MYIPQEDFLNRIMKDISISKTSSAYMIDKNGYTIADVTMETVESNENVEELSPKDSTFKCWPVFMQR